jgi:hypothetical protein
MNPHSESESQATSRRRFFSSGARYVAAGGLAAFTVVQALKGKRLAGDPNCIRLHTCADCVEFSGGCTLDKAEKFRAQS